MQEISSWDAVCSAQCPVESSAEEDGLSDSMLEASSSADDEVDSGSGENNIFDEFFADPASFSKPGPVSGKSSCGMWCSAAGGGSKLGHWQFSFGNSMDRIFGDFQNPVVTYSFNGGDNLVVQWKGTKSQDANKWAATFGGWSKVQLMVLEDGLDLNSGKGAYHISPDLGMGDNAHEVFGKMCAPGGADGKKHKYAIPLQWDGMREMGWTGFPREVLLKHYYRGTGKHMELLAEADVTISACASTSGTDLFKNDPPGSCHSKAELQELLGEVDGELEKDPSALRDGPKKDMNQRHYNELKQILAGPFQETMVNTLTGKEEVGWTKITSSNVGSIKSNLERSSAGSIARDSKSLAKMKPFQKGLLVLKYTCQRPFMDFDGTSAGQFRFENIVIYLAKQRAIKGVLVRS
jgi:hypothetical protein